MSVDGCRKEILCEERPTRALLRLYHLNWEQNNWVWDNNVINRREIQMIYRNTISDLFYFNWILSLDTSVQCGEVAYVYLMECIIQSSLQCTYIIYIYKMWYFPALYKHICHGLVQYNAKITLSNNKTYSSILKYIFHNIKTNVEKRVHKVKFMSK